MNQPQPSGRNGYRALLATYLAPQWRRAVLLLVLLLVSTGLQLVSPQILRAFIDTAAAGGAFGRLTTIALLFGAAALVSQLISVGEAYVAENVSWTATNRLRADLMLHCLQLDQGFHNTHTPGELIERVDGDVGKLGNFFSRFVVQLLGSFLLLIGVLGVSFGIDWRVGAGLSLFCILALGVMQRLRNVGVAYQVAKSEAAANLYGFLEERLGGTEDIRSSGATGYVLRRLYERTRTLLRTTRIGVVLAISTYAVTLVLLALGAVIALGLGAFLFRRGEASIGTVYLIFAYAELLRRPIEEISRQIQDLQQATASIRRIDELWRTRSALRDSGVTPLPSGSLAVTFDQVSFGYGSEMAVVQDVSFIIPPGATLGLLGRTGSGKSTITRLLFHLYDPQAGVVCLNGIDLRNIQLAELRRHIGLVTQEIQLFHATVRDNLTFFDREIPDERIMAVLAELGLGEWLLGLPAGLNTKLAPDSTGLSAGQAQLLALARVFLQDPGLVILDEASSRLDPATERAIELAINRLLKDRTAIIIAHRLHTVLRADAILILERGRILEYGSQAQLAAQSTSHWTQLLATGLAEELA